MERQDGAVHLTAAQLLLLADEELMPSERLRAELHVGACRDCEAALGEVRRASARLQDLFASLVPSVDGRERRELEAALAKQETPLPTGKRKPKRLGWWAAAVAACVAAAALMGPVLLGTRTAETATAQASNAGGVSSFEIDGERFWALPYSNPDLPVVSPRVVQMQVPVASLTEAGIVLAPVGSRVAQPDGAVLANLVLGQDGQPLGVHVLNFD